MRNLVLILLGLVWAAGCAEKKPPPEPPQELPVATTMPAPALLPYEHPVVLIYRETLNANPGRDPVETAVWGDGRIVWRAQRGYLQGRVDPARINDLLQFLHGEGVFGEGHSFYGSFGPDATFDVIEITLPDRSLRLASWHERFAQNPRLVVTSRGVESLNGRDPTEVLAWDIPQYQRFRKFWDELRSTIRSWQPATGDAFDGEMPVPGRQKPAVSNPPGE